MVMLLLLNSILLLGYVQVKHSGLGIILAAIGLIACGVMAGYFIPIQRRLGRMETELGFAADYGVRVGRRRMPWASLVLPLMFAPVWIYSLINSITYVRQ